MRGIDVPTPLRDVRSLGEISEAVIGIGVVTRGRGFMVTHQCGGDPSEEEEEEGGVSLWACTSESSG